MERYSNNTKRLLLVELLIIVSVVCGAFFIPFKEVPIYTIETYTETEYQRRNVTEIVEYEVSRTRQDDPILDLRLELNGNQMWWFLIRQDEKNINFYSSNWNLENGNPSLVLPLKPESAITMEWASMWPSSKEIHGVTINEDKFSIPGNLTNNPEAIRQYIIENALDHQYSMRDQVSSPLTRDATLRMGLVHEDTEKTDTPQVINVRFSHQWDMIETGTREEIKNKTIPVEVEKQRPVILTPRYSMWQIIFSGKFIPLIKGEL